MIHHYVDWFCRNYPDLHKQMISCTHNFDDSNTNPYHIESDCWSHTMMVCKMAEVFRYGKTVQIAALLHDIGKPDARVINPRNNHVMFTGHETISAQKSEPILNAMEREGMINASEKREIIQLIASHSFLYTHDTAEEMLEAFHGDFGFCIRLVELCRCDTWGRFCEGKIDDGKYLALIDALISLCSNTPADLCKSSLSVTLAQSL